MERLDALLGQLHDLPPPPVADLEVGRGEALDRLPGPAHEDVDGHHLALRPEDRRLLRERQGQQERDHRSSSSSSARPRCGSVA